MLFATSAITHSVGRSRQAGVKASCHLRVTRHIQSAHFAPHENGRHVKIGDGKAIAHQIFASRQGVIEHA